VERLRDLLSKIFQFTLRRTRLFYRQATWAFNNSRSTRHYYDARGEYGAIHSSIIEPLSEGNADGTSKETVVKDGPHAGETTGRGGSKEGVGDGMGEWIDDVDKSLLLSRRSTVRSLSEPPADMNIMSSKSLACAPWWPATSWQMGMNVPPCSRVWSSHASFFRAAPRKAPYYPGLKTAARQSRGSAPATVQTSIRVLKVYWNRTAAWTGLLRQ